MKGSWPKPLPVQIGAWTIKSGDMVNLSIPGDIDTNNFKLRFSHSINAGVPPTLGAVVFSTVIRDKYQAEIVTPINEILFGVYANGSFFVTDDASMMFRVENTMDVPLNLAVTLQTFSQYVKERA